MSKSTSIFVASFLLFAAILYNANEARRKEALKPTPQTIVAMRECDGPYNGYGKEYELGYEAGRDTYRPAGIVTATEVVIQSPPEIWDRKREHACWAAGYDAGYLSAQH